MFIYVNLVAGHIFKQSCGLNEEEAGFGFDCDMYVCADYFGPRCKFMSSYTIAQPKNIKRCVCRLGYARYEANACIHPNEPACSRKYGQTVWFENNFWVKIKTQNSMKYKKVFLKQTFWAKAECESEVIICFFLFRLQKNLIKTNNF